MSYLFTNISVVLRLVGEHLAMVGTALILANLIAFPLSLLAYANSRLRATLIGVLGVFYTIPSIALIILFVPLFGLNGRSVVVALVIYTQVILVRNFLAGFQAIPQAVLEAGRGMGMSAAQLWWRVQLPLALPVMLAGVRIAAVVSVAIATVGAKFGAGGLGTLLFQGVTQNRDDKILAGALTVAVLALVLNRGFDALSRALDVQQRLKPAR